ncbi:MAG: amidase [Actinomycetota bacterium]|nr:amidase [Actinomycetota bacterium]
MWNWSAGETAERVRARSVSAVEVTASHLARVQEVNPRLNAITRLNPAALADATEIDRAVARGAFLPLAGVPVTIKDNIDVAGQTTPNGVAALDARVAEVDAPSVASLRSAGAVILGRTNTPEFSWRWHTDNPLFGPTLNPWNPALTPGGSSGGAAAALAAGFGCLAQGNDAGGSVRWPANCTGVVGLKPTVGRIPGHNVTAAGERPLGLELLASQGPMARNVTDVGHMFQVLTSGSWRDPAHVPAAFISDHGMRVGWCLGAGAEPHPDTVAAVSTARVALTEAGWTVTDTEVPDLIASARDWATLINTDFHLLSRRTMLELGSPAMAIVLGAFDAFGPATDLAGVYALLARRSAQIRQWQRLLTESFDVLVLPVTMEPAWPAGDDVTSPARLGGIFASNTPLVALNFLGLPAVALPTGVTGGRPTGVQIVARRFAEPVALAAAAAIERILGTVGIAPI